MSTKPHNKCFGLRNQGKLNVSCATAINRKYQALFSPKNKDFTKVDAGLKIRVRNENLFFLFLNQNICCGFSKEPSQ